MVVEIENAGRITVDAPGSSGDYFMILTRICDGRDDAETFIQEASMISSPSLQAIKEQIDHRPRQEEQDIFL